MDNRHLVTRKIERIPNKNTLKKWHVYAVFSRMFARCEHKEVQNLPPRTPAFMPSVELSSQLRLGFQTQKAKKSIKAHYCHKTMWAWKSAQRLSRIKTPYSPSFPVPEGAGCWPRWSTLVGLAAPNPQKLPIAQRSYPQKIYENCAFPWFWLLSVDFIEENFRQKVIHSLFFSPGSNRGNPKVWRESHGIRLSR